MTVNAAVQERKSTCRIIASAEFDTLLRIHKSYYCDVESWENNVDSYSVK